MRAGHKINGEDKTEINKVKLKKPRLFQYAIYTTKGSSIDQI